MTNTMIKILLPLITIFHLDDALKGFRHAFLIRSPRKSITSYYRAILDNDCGDFGDFDPNEAGFKELNALFVIIILISLEYSF